MFYVYVDWTLGEEPYAFYVGKGGDSRIKFSFRNDFHRNIKKKHGLRREVLFSTRDESFAFEEEIRFIKVYNTYHFDNPKGANFTRGGEGPTGHVQTDEVKKRISEALKGKPKSAKHVQKMCKPRSDASKERMRNAHLGKKRSEDTKQKIRETLLKNAQAKLVIVLE